eukprot:10270551-Lingulodinium_polyedra.AAC.2
MACLWKAALAFGGTCSLHCCEKRCWPWGSLQRLGRCWPFELPAAPWGLPGACSAVRSAAGLWGCLQRLGGCLELAVL